MSCQAAGVAMQQVHGASDLFCQSVQPYTFPFICRRVGQIACNPVDLDLSVCLQAGTVRLASLLPFFTPTVLPKHPHLPAGNQPLEADCLADAGNPTTTSY